MAQTTRLIPAKRLMLSTTWTAAVTTLGDSNRGHRLAFCIGKLHPISPCDSALLAVTIGEPRNHITQQVPSLLLSVQNPVGNTAVNTFTGGNGSQDATFDSPDSRLYCGRWYRQAGNGFGIDLAWTQPSTFKFRTAVPEPSSMVLLSLGWNCLFLTPSSQLDLLKTRYNFTDTRPHLFET